jgi:hypothetical protein
MALTGEVLKANESLQGLSDEQITAIETLSANDENKVIGQKIGELHGQYDQDVMEVAGVEKNQGEKSYDFVKRVLGDFKTKAGNVETLTGEISNLKTTIADYEAKFQAGKGNEALAQKLKDAETKLTQLQGQYDTDKAAWTEKENNFASERTNYIVDTEFTKATAGLKFKAEYPEAVQSTLLKAAKESVLSTSKVDFIDNGKGGKAMVFRDDKGDIIRNPENKLEPMTAGELIGKQLKDVLDTGKQQRGGGTKSPGAGNDDVDLVDLGGAKNQVQADELITKYLMQKGLTRGSAKFAEEQTRIRKDNEVDKLPMR